MPAAPEEELARQEKVLVIYRSNTYIIFHFIMMVLSVYGVMLVTNWGNPNFDNPISFTISSPSPSSYWINVGVAWVTALLYIWTLVAPRLFPDREFA